MSASDEQIIADLSASLRQAFQYIACASGTGEDSLRDCVVTTPVRGGHGRVMFEGGRARDALQAASTRLATIQPRPPSLALRISITHAEQLSEGMSDLLCWCAGFSAAVNHELDRHPYGVEQTRTMREELRDAIARARNLPEEEWTF